MRLNKHYAGIPYLYRKGGAVSTVIEILMRDAVDGKALQPAVNFTVSRYPYFKSAILERHGDFYIAENEMPFRVTETKERRALGSQELNFHMIDVTYYGNQIFVSFHHALCDGQGIKRFLETMLCYYCQFKYHISVEGGDGVLPTPGDLVDPFGKGMYPVDPDVKLPEVVKDGYALPEVPEQMESETEYRQVVTLNNDSFMAYCKQYKASPAVMVSLLMSEAIRSVHPDADKPIICSMASSMRQALDAKTTLKNAVSSINLPYDEATAAMPLSEQVQRFRGIIAEQKEENFVRKSANGMIYLFSKVAEMETLEQKKAVMAVLNDIRINTFVLSYTGRLDLEECREYVVSAQLYSSGNNGLYINMLSVSDTITAEIIQSFESDCYVREFIRLLDEAGVQYEISQRITFSTPKDRVAETPAMEAVRESIDKYAFARSLDDSAR